MPVRLAAPTRQELSLGARYGVVTSSGTAPAPLASLAKPKKKAAGICLPCSSEIKSLQIDSKARGIDQTLTGVRG